ncbi:MAG: hypothetical protein R3174_05430, partial [Gammaproteobacteria bacterium]|nr:hypothetical protein [Gammaproteobacteria bacterium]
PRSPFGSEGSRKDLAALRCPCSRLQVRGSPSVASPFAGMKVHWTFTFTRLAHGSAFGGQKVPRTFCSFRLTQLSFGRMAGEGR